MIDWTKPVETLNGLPIEVVRIHEDGGATIKGLPVDNEVGREIGPEGWWDYYSDGTVANDFLPDLRNTATAELVSMDYPTLRDRFAMAALTGLYARGGVEAPMEEMAKDCYRIADAMLRARGEG
ncbi:MAG: hypothetical protein ABW128_15495 [Rhizorhabdus sp.]